MIEIDIFNYNEEDVKEKVYNNPVKLIIKKETFEEAKRLRKIHKNRSVIAFKHVVFNSEVSINVDEGVDHDILISFHYCFIDSFSPFALESKNVSLYFGSSILDSFVARDVPLASIQFNNCFGSFTLENLKKCHISYTEENIFYLQWEKLVSTTRFNSFDDILSIKTRFNIVDVIDVNFYGNEFDKERRNELQIDDNNVFTDNIAQTEEYKQKKLLTKEEKLKLDLTISLKYNVGKAHQKTKITKLLLNSIQFEGKPEGEIIVDSCKVDNVFIRNFSPKGDFTLYNIETRGLTKGKFEVHNSNLDNTWFNSVKLNQYFIVFFKSSFINTKFSSTIFPSTDELLKSSLSSVENIHYPEEKSEEEAYNRDMYELFLELKQAFEKRGNVFEAQKMKAVAHDFLNKITSGNARKSEFWNSTSILWLNKISNFHGVSVRNAFWAIFASLCLFHWLNILSFDSYYLTVNSWDEVWTIFKDTFKYIFVIANPAHKVSSLAPEGEVTSYTYAVSFFSRIAVGYLYYQFIAAFRRFGK